MQRTLSLASSSSTFLALALALASYGCGGSTSSGGEAPGAGGDDDGGTKTHADGGSGSDSSTPGDDDDASTPLPEGVVAVPLYQCTPLTYAADVTVGSQAFRAIVDTGSTSFGVAGTGCTSCGVTPLYTPGSTAVDQKKKASSQFGSGSWSGEIYQDAVATTPATPVPMKLVSITQQQGILQKGATCGGQAFHGLMGFSQKASAVSGTDGYFDAYVANSKNVANVFGMELCDNSGTMWLGGYDQSATAGAMQWVPMTTDGASDYYYAVVLKSITVEGTTVPVASGQYNDSLVDTGTSIFLLGETAYNGVAKALQATAGFKALLGAQASQWFSQQGACADLGKTKEELDAALPKVTLTFDNGATVEAVATESYLEPYEGAGWCNALLSQPQDQNFPIASIMGAPILRSSVVVYDRAQKRIGFAPHKACPTARVQAAPGSVAPALGLKPRIGYPGLHH